MPIFQNLTVHTEITQLYSRDLHITILKKYILSNIPQYVEGSKIIIHLEQDVARWVENYSSSLQQPERHCEEKQAWVTHIDF